MKSNIDCITFSNEFKSSSSSSFFLDDNKDGSIYTICCCLFPISTGLGGGIKSSLTDNVPFGGFVNVVLIILLITFFETTSSFPSSFDSGSG
jgi:hypothetical protein